MERLQLLELVPGLHLALLAGLAGALAVLKQPVLLAREHRPHGNQAFDRHSLDVDKKLADEEALAGLLLGKLAALIIMSQLDLVVGNHGEFMLALLGHEHDALHVVVSKVADEGDTTGQLAEELQDLLTLCQLTLATLFFLGSLAVSARFTLLLVFFFIRSAVA